MTKTEIRKSIQESIDKRIDKHGSDTGIFFNTRSDLTEIFNNENIYVSVWTWNTSPTEIGTLVVVEDVDWGMDENPLEVVKKVHRKDGVWVSQSGTPLEEVFLGKAKFYTVDDFVEQFGTN